MTGFGSPLPQLINKKGKYIMIKKLDLHIAETYCPVFNGFYASIWEEMADRVGEEYMLFNEPDNVKEEYTTFIEDNIQEFVNYKQYRIDLCKDIIWWFNNYFKENNLCIKFKFQELSSPRYYNYGNDSINIKVLFTKEFVTFLTNYVNKNCEKFNSYLNDNYTSCSGFISYLSNDVEEWKSYINSVDLVNSKHYLGSLLQFYFSNEGITEDGNLYEAMQDIYISNGKLDNYLNYDDLVSAINKEFNLNISSLSQLENI